jgi:hypothetical protein
MLGPKLWMGKAAREGELSGGLNACRKVLDQVVVQLIGN